MTVDELAQRLGAGYKGNGSLDLTSAAPVESAGASELSFVANEKNFPAGTISRAGCLIVPATYPQNSQTVIHDASPRNLFARAAALLYPLRRVEPGVHPTAVIAPSAMIDAAAEIGPHVSIAEGARIGKGTRIEAGSSIGRDVEIGANCVLHSNVTIYEAVRIGNGVILHSGCIIGADGFGFVLREGRYEKFPQVGRVEIEDHVEIGANSCVDRAALGVTRIGEGAKIDNMVHIGHNCQIGRHVVIAAQTGFSGGVVVEDYAVIGGQVGIGDKARIETRAVLGSGCGVLTSKIVRAGEVVWGTPARPLRKYLEQLANLSRVGEMREELKMLKNRLAKMEER